MKQVACAYPDVELHLVVDNYAAHKHPAVNAWLAANPRVVVHFTPAPRLVDEPGRGLVLDHRTPSDPPRNLRLGERPERQDPHVHQPAFDSHRQRTSALGTRTVAADQVALTTPSKRHHYLLELEDRVRGRRSMVKTSLPRSMLVKRTVQSKNAALPPDRLFGGCVKHTSGRAIRRDGGHAAVPAAAVAQEDLTTLM